MKEPLKAGDRVAVYGVIPGAFSEAPIRRTGCVTDPCRFSNGLVEVKLDAPLASRHNTTAAGCSVWTVHKKQCRRLKPKKRREFWAIVEGLRFLCEYENEAEARGEAARMDREYPNDGPHDVVLLREVRK